MMLSIIDFPDCCINWIFMTLCFLNYVYDIDLHAQYANNHVAMFVYHVYTIWSLSNLTGEYTQAYFLPSKIMSKTEKARIKI